jgi:L-ribulose-5-phosphate 3-epimerase
MNRRDFARTTFAAAVAARTVTGQDKRFIKGICAGIFPNGTPFRECFKQARNAGFDAIELPIGGEITLETPADEVKKLGEAAKEAGLAIASMWVSRPLDGAPLNSADPQKRARGVEAIRKSIELATYMNCGSLLLVPGRLGTGPRFEVGYETTWQRFTEELKKVIPDAARAKVILAMENVGNKFLVSPLEMRAFVDQFKSPWLQMHFDVANVMSWGYPEDWILTLGPRIKRVHLKDRKLPGRNNPGGPSALGEGDVNWKDVMAAFVKVGYSGFMCPEIGHDPNDPDQLKKVSAAVDKIFALA